MSQSDHAVRDKSGAVQGTSAALRFVVLIGVVSFFADMTYEGSRSITGPYLALLGASATIVGIVAGGGELLGYTLRIVSGRFADITGRYWPITLVGYVVQMAAVPALALVGSWQAAAILIALERVGKALRNPPRDAMLAHATLDIGRGWGFGLHEALDQAGALVGPLLAAAVLAARGQYQVAFAVLLVPALLTLGMLVVARISYPDPSGLAARPADVQTGGLPRELWIYLGATMLVAAGFADFSLIAFHFAQARTVPADWVPLFYAAAMGVSGIGSLAFGRLFDRAGIVVLVPLTLVSACFAPLVFLGTPPAAFIGTVLWGLGMGVQESIMAAAVAGMVPSRRLASAYGLFNLLYGLAWFLGSATMGVLYEVSLPALVSFSVAVELLAVPLIFAVHRRRRSIAA
ncbi:MAG: MFS transporter [Devosia sp.]|nr:MFS transporter [Devosia sp.]